MARAGARWPELDQVTLNGFAGPDEHVTFSNLTREKRGTSKVFHMKIGFYPRQNERNRQKNCGKENFHELRFVLDYLLFPLRSTMRSRMRSVITYWTGEVAQKRHSVVKLKVSYCA